MSKKLCRLCMKLTLSYYLLREDEIAKMFQALIPIEYLATNNDIICVQCSLHLKSAYKFQQQVIDSFSSLPYQLEIEPDFDLTFNQYQIEDDDFIGTINYTKLCQVCGCSTTRKTLNKHLNEHFTEKQKCSICSEELFNIESLRNHWRLKHNNEKPHPFKCLNCGLSFQYQSMYDLHTTKVCNLRKNAKLLIKMGNKVSQPNIKEVGNKENLSKPGIVKTKSKKRKTRLMVCYEAWRKTLPPAQPKEPRNGSGLCHVCGFCFRGLTQHIEVCHNPQRTLYPCNMCPKKYSKTRLLQKHVRIEHQGIKDFKCGTCGTEFFKRDHLLKHIRTTHLKLQPFICTYCKKGFSTKTALTCHIRLHKNELSFECEFCSAGFPKKVLLKNHLRSKHEMVDENVL